MDVVIITHCRDADSLPTNLLTIRSVQVGYPDANTTVVDNGSPPAHAQAIERQAMDHGLRFLSSGHYNHAVTIRWVFETYRHSRRPLVILDPDVVFWERFDSPDALLAGRLIPAFTDTYSQTFTHPRLHTSHLFTADPAGLWSRIADIEASRPNVNLITPVTVLREGRWERFDTAALLYAALGDEARAFTEDQLDTFDHLFCGSSLGLVAPTLAADAEETLRTAHRLAVTDPQRLKGIWRAQEAFFRGDARTAGDLADKWRVHRG